MSIEAMNYVKRMDLGKSERAGARLLLMVIAESTFNDSLACRLSQAEMAYQCRVSIRTVQRHLASMEEDGLITIGKRGGHGDGRLPDAIMIQGFAEHITKERAEFSGSKTKPPQDVVGAGRHSVRLGNTTKHGQARGATRHQESRTEESRTRDSRTRGAHARAEDSDSDSSSGPRLVTLEDGPADAVHRALIARLGRDVHRSWFAKLALGEPAGSELTAWVPIKFLRNWIASHYLDDLLACVRAVYPDVSNVRIEVGAPAPVEQENVA